MQGGNQTGAQALHAAGMDGVTLPPSLKASPEFVAAWSSWESYMAERVDRWTVTSQRLQIQECAGWGASRAIAAIEWSKKKNYASLNEPKAGTNGENKPKQRPLKPGEIEHYG